MTLTVADLARKMRDIDTCMLCTRTADGVDTRPMSNNREVDWDGTSWYFALESTGLVQQIEDDPVVMVTYTGEFGFWASVHGTAKVHTERALMEEHFDPDIERWFEQGLDTEGLRLIEVVADRVRYWTFEDGDGEITL